MTEPKKLTGYVRCGVTFAGADFGLQILATKPSVALFTVETMDGNVDIGIRRGEAADLLQKLKLFLQEWPDDTSLS